MYVYKLPNAAASKIAVTSAATTLLALIDTAAATPANLPSKINAVIIIPEDGDVRVLFDGNTPTATNGLLLSQGTRNYFANVPITKMQLIRVGGANVNCSVNVGLSDPEETMAFTSPTVNGGVASGATDSGNPIKIGGIVVDLASLPSGTIGQRINASFSPQGELLVYNARKIAGEDQTIDVMKVEERFSYSAVAVVDTQIKASAGFLHSVTISCNDAAPTAGSIIIYDNTAESGTIVFNHTFTTTPFVPFTIILDISMLTGIYVGMTTTGDVNFSCSFR